jgi:streptogramin lyase
MRKRTWTLLLASLLAAAPAGALEPDDLVIGVGTSLYTVDPLTGALDLLSEGPTDPGRVTDIAVRPDGGVFFAQTSFVTATSNAWRLDPQTGERSAIYLPGQRRICGLAMDRLGNLVVCDEVSSTGPGLQAELIWVDPETGEELLVIPVSPTVPVFGISDIAIDPEGRVLLLAEPSGILRIDPRTGELETLGSGIRGPGVIAVEADGSILVANTLCSSPLPPGTFTLCESSLERTDPDTGEVQILSTIAGQSMDVAVETDGGIVVSTVPGPRTFGPGSVVRVDPDDGSQTLVVGDLPAVGAIGIVPPPEARIEVRPSRLRVGPTGRRKLRVVLFGSEHLDVEEVDLDSLAFGPDGAAPLAGRVVRRGADPFPDLLLLFRAGQAGFRPGDTSACLEGTANGFAFRACDTIRVLGAFNGFHSAGGRIQENDKRTRALAHVPTPPTSHPDSE